jgi:hypothetical protein
MERHEVCTCDTIGIGIVHDGDCPCRCTYHIRDSRSEAIAQCEHLPGHDGTHLPNLYRGSPSRRRERGLGDRAWPIPEPVCDEPAAELSTACPYYYLEPERSCTLRLCHREQHVLRTP